MLLIYTFLILNAGSYLVAVTSPRPWFNSWRGANATDDTTVNALNWHLHKFAAWVVRRWGNDNAN